MADTTTTITVRIPVELRDELDRLAAATRRSRSFLAAEALGAYARNELEIIDGLAEGIADFEAGRVTPHEEVIAQSRALLAELKTAKRPADKMSPRRKVAAR